jgi:hypothetical protein
MKIVVSWLKLRVAAINSYRHPSVDSVMYFMYPLNVIYEVFFLD